MKIKIITNNSTLIDKKLSNETNISEVIFLDTFDILEVMIKTRDYIHKGHKLLTHPLSGSVKPTETPFKSIAITDLAGDIDINSIDIISQAILTSEKFKRTKNYRLRASEDILDDFRIIDYELIKSGIDTLL